MVVTDLVAGVLAIVVGLLLCFLGYRLVRVAIVLAGFAVGAGLGWWGTSLTPGVSYTFALVVALLCGILGAVLAAVLYKVGVFLLGAAGAAALAAIALFASGHPISYIVLAAAGVAGGLVTLFLQRLLVSLFTAFGGAFLAVAGVLQFAGWLRLADGFQALSGLRSSAMHSGLMLGLWLVLGILGSTVQLRGAKKKK